MMHAGRAVKLAADQSGGAGQFVGDGFKAGVQSVAVRIAAAAIVAQRFHSGDANAEVDQAFAPGTAEGVGDENGNGEFGALLEFAMKFAGGAVGIGGQKQGVPAAIDVGDIYAAVGADETVTRLGDEHAVLAPDYGAALAQGKLDDASIQFVFLRPGDRMAEGLIVARSTMRPSALETILCLTTRMSPGLNARFMLPQRLQQFVGERVAGIDFIRERNRDDA